MTEDSNPGQPITHRHKGEDAGMSVEGRQGVLMPVSGKVPPGFGCRAWLR